VKNLFRENKKEVDAKTKRSKERKKERKKELSIQPL
jgi:hypothetical protein